MQIDYNDLARVGKAYQKLQSKRQSVAQSAIYSGATPTKLHESSEELKYQHSEVRCDGCQSHPPFEFDLFIIEKVSPKGIKISYDQKKTGHFQQGPICFCNFLSFNVQRPNYLSQLHHAIANKLRNKFRSNERGAHGNSSMCSSKGRITPKGSTDRSAMRKKQLEQIQNSQMKKDSRNYSPMVNDCGAPASKKASEKSGQIPKAMIKINKINFVDQSREHPQVAIMDIKSGSSEIKSAKIVKIQNDKIKKSSPLNSGGRQNQLAEQQQVKKLKVKPASPAQTPKEQPRINIHVPNANMQSLNSSQQVRSSSKKKIRLKSSSRDRSKDSAKGGRGRCESNQSRLSNYSGKAGYLDESQYFGQLKYPNSMYAAAAIYKKAKKKGVPQVSAKATNNQQLVDYMGQFMKQGAMQNLEIDQHKEELLTNLKSLLSQLQNSKLEQVEESKSGRQRSASGQRASTSKRSYSRESQTPSIVASGNNAPTTISLSIKNKVNNLCFTPEQFEGRRQSRQSNKGTSRDGSKDSSGSSKPAVKTGNSTSSFSSANAMSIMQQLAAQQKQQIMQITDKKSVTGSRKIESAQSASSSGNETSSSGSLCTGVKGAAQELLKMVQKNMSVERKPSKTTAIEESVRKSRKAATENSLEREPKKNHPSIDRQSQKNQPTDVDIIGAEQITFHPGSQVPAPKVEVKDDIMKDREQIIKFIKHYIAKHNKLPPTTLDYYKFLKLIGKGAFGKVTLCIHKLTGKKVAVKTIDKNYMKDDFSKRKVFQEIYILKKIRHSNIIRLLEVFESPKHMLIVMEYADGGDLLHFIKKVSKLSERDTKYIFKQIVYGLAHCHCRSVLHRDIKLDNILLDGESGVKICDFGVSKIIKKGQLVKEQCGTPAYIAPEVITDEGYEGYYVDVWSLGVLLYAMLCKTVPFKASNMAELHELIKKGDFTYPVSLSAEAQDLINNMLKMNPKDRHSIPQILNHAWLKETNDDSDSDEAQETQREEEHKKDPTLEAMSTTGPPLPEYNMLLDNTKVAANINFVNVDNLFYSGDYKQKLSYTDYCCITEDFTTHHLDEEAIKVVEKFGFPREFLVRCLNQGDLNHATACYYLQVMP